MPLTYTEVYTKKTYENLIDAIITQKMEEKPHASYFGDFKIYSRDDEQDFVIVHYEENRDTEKTVIFNVALWSGIFELETFDGYVTELYYDGDHERFYTRKDLFEEWKKYLEDEDETFIDCLREATGKNGTLDRII